MTNPTNWPNPERPGYPPEPEKDGLYVVCVECAFLVRYWSAKHERYSLVQNWKNGASPNDMKNFDYVGQVFGHEELTELLAKEQQSL